MDVFKYKLLKSSVLYFSILFGLSINDDHSLNSHSFSLEVTSLKYVSLSLFFRLSFLIFSIREFTNTASNPDTTNATTNGIIALLKVFDPKNVSNQLINIQSSFTSINNKSIKIVSFLNYF